MIFLDTTQVNCDCACSVSGNYALSSFCVNSSGSGGYLSLEMLRDYGPYTHSLHVFVTGDLGRCFETHAEAIIRALPVGHWKSLILVTLTEETWLQTIYNGQKLLRCGRV